MHKVWVSTLALTLAACGGSGSGNSAHNAAITLTNVSEAELAKQVETIKAQTQIQPGAWEYQAEIVSVDLPGVPEPMRSQAIEELTRPQPALKQCVTPGSSIASNPALLQAVGKDCVYQKYALGNGRIELAATCKGSEGQPVTATLTGTYSGSQADFLLKQHIAAPAGQPGAEDLALRIKSRRTGDCPKS